MLSKAILQKGVNLAIMNISYNHIAELNNITNQFGKRDFKLRLDYIHFNPLKHGLVSNVKDWEYSSFHKFVKLGEYDKEWCDFDKSIEL